MQTVKGYFATLNLPQDCSLSLSDYLHTKKTNHKEVGLFFVEVEFYKKVGRTLLEKAVS